MRISGQRSWGGRGLSRRRRLAPVALAAVLFGLTGAAEAATLYGLTTNNILLRFQSATPGTIEQAVVISGLQAGERIVGIDFRPRTASSTPSASSPARPTRSAPTR